jgi:hypothetical protein
MKKFNKILILFLLVCSSISLFAQFDTEEVDTLENMILYNREKTYSVILHNLGWGFQYRTGKRVTYFKTRMIEVEFLTMRSYKQVKVLNPYVPNSRKYVYGKMNDAFFLHGGLVWKKLLNRKPYGGGVEIRANYGGGLSLGFAKPYYLYVMYFYELPGGSFNYFLQTERFDPSQQSWDDIYGRAPFSEGLGEITVHPGIYLKAGLNFEYGTRSTKIKAIEIGGTIDILPSGLTIMASSADQIFFPSIYLNFSFGKRFNKY